MGLEDNGTEVNDVTTDNIETPWDEEAAQELLSNLEKISDKEGVKLIGNGPSMNVNEIIDSIKNKTPEGVKFVELYQRANADLQSRGEKQKGFTGEQEEITGPIGTVISKIKGLFS